ncbi:hypothetical protein Q8A67_013215 [Cirrhinus molitorella]|uniref:LIM zinc-binding domain-containing protein n=1 Tax=Cirrhinus molitorella TaxID=172907 RepID=A0AA88PSS4_9TELE|nr:hypothetical protein Q8A67_013215 [Cirrhinus molitorella]
MSKEGDRQSVLRTTKVRTFLKGDNSWIQRREQEDLEKEEEEEKPWIAEVRANRSSGVFEEPSPVSSPTVNVPQPKSDTEKSGKSASGYIIRGVFTKTDSKPTSTSSTNGYAGINSFNKKPSESYKKIAPHTIRSSNEKVVQSEPTLSTEEMEKRKEAASSVLKGSAANRRSYVMSAAKKYESTEKPDSSAEIATSFVAKRVDISDDDETTVSVKSVPVQSVKSNAEPVVKEVKPAAPEIKSEPMPVTKTNLIAQTKITTEANTTPESKPVLENTTQPKTASEPKPASQTKPVTQTTTVAETKPTAQTKTVTEPKPTSEPKPVETKPTTTETKTATETKPATQTSAAADPKPTSETKPVETKLATKTESKSAIETKTQTVSDPKPTSEPKPTTTETKTATETKPATQTSAAADPKPTSEPKPVETKLATKTESKSAIETKTQTTTVTDPKPTSETKPVEIKTTTEPKPVTETKTVTETKPATQTSTATESKLVVETKSTTQTSITNDPKPPSEPKAVENKPTTTNEPKIATQTKTVTESKLVTETKPSTQTTTATDPKPTSETKPVATEPKPATETKKATETKPTTQPTTATDLKSTSETKPVTGPKTEPEAKSTTQLKPAPEPKPEPVPEKSSDTLISFNTEPASSTGVDLLSHQDLLTDSSSLPNKTHEPLDLLADDLIPFNTSTTRTSTDYTSSWRTRTEDFKSSVDEFDPIRTSSEPTKSPQWYGPPKLDSSSIDTFNHFQHPLDLVADTPPDISVSLAEDIRPTDTKSDWKTDMDSYKTSTSTKTITTTVESSDQDKLPESDSKKNFVYVKEYVNNSCLDGSSSDYVSSTSSNYNYSSPSYYSRREMTPCTYCGEMVGNDAKITIEHLNISCHPLCFKCGICSKPMGDLLHNMFLHRGTVHCESCYSNVL